MFKIQDFYALYINLEKDIERKDRTEKILKKLKIKNERIDAIYGIKLKNKSYR